MIVVGSGAAGMTAVVRCRSLGIERVVVIEKFPVQGGNSSIAVGDICAVDSPITRKAGVKDSVEHFGADFTRAGCVPSISIHHLWRKVGRRRLELSCGASGAPLRDGVAGFLMSFGRKRRAPSAT